MKYRFFLVLIIFYSTLSFCQQQRFVFTEPKMGSPFTIIVYNKDSLYVKAAAVDCFRFVDSMNAIFSDYDSTSELSNLRFVAGFETFIKPSPMLYDILQHSYEAWKQSENKFDVTIGVLTHLWRNVLKTNTFPLKNDIEFAQSQSGFKNVIIDTIEKKIKILKPGLRFDLGGIAKGYVAQKVIDLLKTKNILSALVDAGGDIVTGDPPPGLQHWRLGIALPQSEVLKANKNIFVSNAAVATSGATYQHIEHKGKQYSHIIDPKSGYGITFKRNVTVVAKDGAEADWLASACSVLPLQKAKRVAQKRGAEVIITWYRKGKLKITSTRNINQYLDKANN